MRSISFVVSLVCAIGCEKAKEPRFEGPMPLAFGDCAATTVAWVSGPRPLPFTPEEALGISAAPPVVAAAPPIDAGVEIDAGSAMALDEGRMGKRDSDRVEGQYKMRRNTDDPQLARQQAIEQARAAGIIGSTALQQGGAFASLTGTGDISGGLDDSNIYGGLLGNEAGEMNGGFGYGRTGFGAGGGTGTGWGTIGTGRYGTISGTGHGYGVGGGRGGMRGRTAAVPTVSIGQPNAQGDLDKAIIRRYIKRNLSKLQYCYEKQLLAKPKLAGTVTAQFVIAQNGTVSSSSASGVDPSVSTCVADVIHGIEFPKPKGGGVVQVNYPFTFRQAEDAAPLPPATPAAGAGSAAGSASSESPPPPPEAESKGSGSATVEHGAATRSMFRTVPLTTDPSHYAPGTANPLRAQDAALSECLRKNPSHYGVVVFELAYDAAGKVATARPYGIDDEDVRACVSEVASRVTRVGSGIGAQRCSLAFGVMPATGLPAIDITSDAISLDGKSLGTPQAVMKDDSPTWRIPEVVTALEYRIKAAVAPTAPIVALHGPLAIRPVDATSMRVVTRVLNSVVAADDDFVLARHRGPSWELLAPMTLPVVPVPLGTGGKWRHIKVKRRDTSAIASDEEHVTLSLLVTKQQIWIGISRVMEFQELKREPAQVEKLLTALKEHRASAFFADRTDLEIAAEDDVTYGEVADVVDVAMASGFSDWLITDPQALAAHPTL